MQTPTEPVPSPLPLDAPLPHRKVIRSWLIPLSQRTTVRAFVLLAIDYLLFGALHRDHGAGHSSWLKLLAGLLAGFVIGRLFIIGHDGCHQSLTPHRRAQQVARAHRLPALAHGLQPLGHGPQRGPPRLHQPEGRGLRLGAADARRVPRAVAGRPPAPAPLSQRLGPGGLLHDRDLVEEDDVPDAEGAGQTRCARSSGRTACW